MRILLIFLLMINVSVLYAENMNEQKKETVEEESLRLQKLFHQYAKFYDIPEGVDYLDITEAVLESPLVFEKNKQIILLNQRKIILFTYPSDGLKIKALISYVPQPENQKTMLLLRGGNKIFGLLNPGTMLLNMDKLTIISTTNRGGVSEGEDEYGGEDVNDIKNLVDYLPELENKLNIQMQKEDMFLLGASRGGMQMFLFLARFPEMQSRFSKAVSLSGLLDMHENIKTRPDLVTMFIEEFGLKKTEDEDWINARDPILAAEKIDPRLSLLIMQGGADNRVSLEEGYHMISTLKKGGHEVSYMEFADGDHCLTNIKNFTDIIINWLYN